MLICYCYLFANMTCFQSLSFKIIKKKIDIIDLICLVAIVIILVWSIDWDIDIIGLLLCEFG